MQSKISVITDIKNLGQLSKKNKLYINISFFSILFLPIFLFAGPLITEFLVLLIVFSYIYSLILEKKKISFKNFEIIIISFFCLLVISSLVSDYKLISLKSSFLSIRFIILIYAVIFIIKKLDYFFKYFFIFCLASVLTNIFAGFIQFILSDKFFLMLQANTSFILTGFFGDEKKLGSFLCRISPLIVGSYLLFSKKKIEKKINIVIVSFALLFFFVFLTSERMALVYCVITFFFIIFTAIKINKNFVIIFPIIIIFIPLLMYELNFIKFKHTVDNTYKQLFPKGKLVFYSKQHQIFAMTSIELFKKNPFLGVGPNNYRRECHNVNTDLLAEKYNFLDKNIENCSTHPHNIFFQLLAETGLVGIVYYIIFNMFLFF